MGCNTTPGSAPMIGRTFGHYRITAKLGAGGMGEVFLAEDARLDRKAAIKFLPAEWAGDPGGREGVLAEGEGGGGGPGAAAAVPDRGEGGVGAESPARLRRVRRRRDRLGGAVYRDGVRGR